MLVEVFKVGFNNLHIINIIKQRCVFFPHLFFLIHLRKSEIQINSVKFIMILSQIQRARNSNLFSEIQINSVKFILMISLQNLSKSTKYIHINSSLSSAPRLSDSIQLNASEIQRSVMLVKFRDQV